MAIRVQCSGCGKKLAVKDELSGRRVKCPGCGDVFSVSAKVGASVAQARPPKPPAASAAPRKSNALVLGTALGVAIVAIAVVVYIIFTREKPGDTGTIAAQQPAQPPLGGQTISQEKPDPATKTEPETKSAVPEPKPEPKPRPKPQVTPKAERPREPEAKVASGGPPPQLQQTVKSIRVVLAEPLARDRILKLLREAYEPAGVKIVVSRAEDKDPISEDVTLIATYFSQAAGQFTPANQSAYYLWVDMQRELMYMVDQRGSSNFLSPMDGVNPPKYLHDPAPFVDLRLETRSGIPTDDLKYVFFREGSGPETIGVYDVAKKEVASKQKVQASYTSRLVLGSGLLCSINSKGIEVFDLTGLPNLGKGQTFFTMTESSQIKDVVVQGRNVIATVDGKLNVVHWPAGGEPRVSFTDETKSGQLVVNDAGEIRLFALSPEGAFKPPTELRLGKLEADGSVKLGSSMSAKTVDANDPGWRLDASGCLRANLLWYNNGRLQLWWHGDPKQPKHLCDLPMVSGSKVTAKGVKGLPQWQGRSLLLAGPLLANFAQDYGVRRLPGGQLLVYYGGTVLRLKHFP